MRTESGRRRQAIIALVLLAALALVMVRYRLPDGMLDDPKAAVESWAARGGWIAVIVYALAGSLLGGLGLPPALFIAPMGLLWPLRVALPLAVCSGLGAAMVGFWIGRFAGELLPMDALPPRLKRYEARLQHGGFGTVVVVRLLFFLFPPVNWIMGMSRIGTGVFAVGTTVGLLPHAVLFVVTGGGVLPWLLRQPAWATGGCVLLIVVIVCGYAWCVHRRVVDDDGDGR